MLKQLGLDTPHELMGADGCVSCYFLPGSEYYPHSPYNIHPDTEKVEDFSFDLVVHLVRNPLECIPSNTKIMNKAHQEWCALHGLLDMRDGPKLLRMMQMWENLNQRIEEEFPRNMRMRIESMGDLGIKKIARQLRLAVPINFEPKHMHKGSGYLKADRATWEELECIDPALTKKIKRRARRYGYR
jgi:hypothetical protein